MTKLAVLYPLCRYNGIHAVVHNVQIAAYQDDQIKRSIYYAVTLTHNALSSGEPYSFLPHVYQIMFMDFRAVEDNRLHHTYLFKERKDHAELSDIVQIHYIELAKNTTLFRNIATVPETVPRMIKLDSAHNRAYPISIIYKRIGVYFHE